MSKFTADFAIQVLQNYPSVSINVQAEKLLQSTLSISGVQIDSRQCINNSLFVAFKGEQVDGHEYVESALTSGASLVVVDHFVDVDIAQVRVSNCQQALVNLAKSYRATWHATKIVALTGSAGKTSTKDILEFLLSQQAKTQATLGNLNNELGVPLTLLNTNIDTDFLIVEMGAAELGDIAYLMEIVQPDIGLITNIGDAHIGRFGSVENIVKAKTEMFTHLNKQGIAILNADDAFYSLFQTTSFHAETLSFSFSNKADVFIEKQLDPQCISLNYAGVVVELTLPFTAKHQINNFLAAACCMKALGFEVQTLNAIHEFKNVSEHRQIVIPLSNGIDVIDDTYNSNPVAMKSAIDYTALIAGDERRMLVVFGAMGELGDYSDAKHIEITEYAFESGVSSVIFCGDKALPAYEYCLQENLSATYCDDAEAAYYDISKQVQASDVVLIKGSRAIGLDRTVKMIINNENNNTWGYSACC